MKNTAIIEFVIVHKQEKYELEVPLDISANELILALNNAYQLGMKLDDMFNCYLIAENPIAFLKGNRTLAEFGVRNGTIVMHKNGK